jgi:uncharacterized membrane protein YdjX (TVP38/TMEM64 family)
MQTNTASHNGTRAPSALSRWAPLIILGLLTALAFSMGWHKYLSFKTVGLNYEALRVYIAENFVLALAIYMLTYIVAVALSLPGGLVLTLSGGLLFGWKFGTPATVVAATIGATIIFLVARSSFGEVLTAKAGPWLSKLSDGFKENALSYLLFLRLVPAFPFFVVNLVPAVLGVPLRTYVIGTFLGIIPATAAFSFLGSGLGSVVEAQNAAYHACRARAAADAVDPCPYSIDTSALVTSDLIAAFVLLGVVALIPVIYKKWSQRHAAV